MLRFSYLTPLVCLFFFKLHSHTQEEIIVKFNYSYLDYEFIDDKNKKEASLNEIFNEEAERQLHLLEFKFPELLESNVTKIFDFLSTEDSVSISRHGHKVTIPPFWAVFNLEIPAHYKSEEIIEFLDKFHPLVEYAHRNFEVIPLNVPNDSLYYRQEGLFDPAGLADINVEQAWETETGKKFIKVGVHDNGVDSLHPDIELLTGGDYFQNDTLPG
ncbi:MAG: hypothetical protein R3277_07715 [Brumimicrobium sp.]|nr:hypothetical protein [Brumimicrobium sp.]